jgi:hypothetical protein
LGQSSENLGRTAVVTPDNRYAFISVEGVGTDPGTVEVIDLQSLMTVATIDVPEQAAGSIFGRLRLLDRRATAHKVRFPLYCPIHTEGAQFCSRRNLVKRQKCLQNCLTPGKTVSNS